MTQDGTLATNLGRLGGGRGWGGGGVTRSDVSVILTWDRPYRHGTEPCILSWAGNTGGALYSKEMEPLWHERANQARERAI